MSGQRSYRGYRFPHEIIGYAVGLPPALSFGDVEDFAERGVIVTYESIRQWCLSFGPA